MEITTHVSEEILEAFVMNRLQAEETEQLEDHLLLCRTCRKKLDEVRQDVQAIRLAAARVREERLFRASRKRWWHVAIEWAAVKPIWMLAGTGVAVALLSLPLLREPQISYREVALATVRGGPEEGVTTGKNVRLRLRLGLNGVEEAQSYVVSVVNLSGESYYRSGPVSAGNREQLTIGIERTLPPGQYWVRLSSATATDQVLREYRLQVN